MIAIAKFTQRKSETAGREARRFFSFSIRESLSGYALLENGFYRSLPPCSLARGQGNLGVVSGLTASSVGNTA